MALQLLQQFEQYIKENDLFHAKDKLLLAVSGGVDSTVLCHLCKEAGFDFIIAHCNFKLRGTDSDRDEEFVKKMAGKLAVPFYSKSFDTKKIAAERKTGIEETARELRYAWFNELLDPAQSPIPAERIPVRIVTGHHADDQIETVMMNFFRGTGIKGIRGILPMNDKIVRPLLFARRVQMEGYAKQQQLEFVHDHTNEETTITRNFFRHRVLPMVEGTFPATGENILHNAGRLKEVEELYNQAIALHKSKLLEKKGNEIHIPALKLKKSRPLTTIVYEIIKDFGFTAHQVPELIALLDSESGKYITSSTHRIIRNRKWLIISPTVETEAGNIIIEESTEKVPFALGTLQLQRTNDTRITAHDSVVSLDLKDISFPLLLRKWKTGDYFYPLGMKKKKKIARFLIDQKLSKTEKEKVWVIESNYRIIWVVGHRIDDRFKMTGKTKTALQLELT